MIALDPASTRRYVLKDERALPSDCQSVFLLRNLTSRELAQIQDRATALTRGSEQEESISIRSGSTRMQALKLGLVGWENVRDRNGAQVEFRGTKQKVAGVEFISPDDTTLDRIPPKYRFELAEEITSESELTTEEVGNS